MDNRQILFLEAYKTYREVELQLGMEIAATRGLYIPSPTLTQLENLQQVMAANETPAFNSQNVRQHLKALSAQNQDLSVNLDLKNPEHRARVEICALAFSDNKIDWDSSTLPLPAKFQAARLKLDMLSSERRGEIISSDRSAALGRTFAQGAIAAGIAGPIVGLADAVVASASAIIASLIDYSFQASPELTDVVSKEFAELLPEYFLSGRCPDALLTEEARVFITEQRDYRLGQVALYHAAQNYALQLGATEQAKEVMLRVGQIVSREKEDTHHFLNEATRHSLLRGASMGAKEALKRSEHSQAMQQSLSVKEEAAHRQLVGILLLGMDGNIKAIRAHQLAEEQRAIAQARIQRAQTAAQELAQLGEKIGSPLLMKVGQIGSLTMKLQQSIESTQQAFASGGLGGSFSITSCFSFLSGPIGITMAAVSLVSLFSKRRNSEGEALNNALHSISQQIQQLHKAMATGFDETWKILNDMEKRQAQRYRVTMEALLQIHKIMEIGFSELNEKIEKIDDRLRTSLASLEEHMNHMEDRPLRRVLKELPLTENAKRLAKHATYTAAVTDWLVDTATLANHSGRLLEHKGPCTSEELRENLKQASSPSRFGFYFDFLRSLPSQEMSVFDPKLLVKVDSWLQVFSIYQYVIALVSEGIANSIRKDAKIETGYREQFEKIAEIAKANLTFMEKAFENRHNFISTVSAHYEKALCNIVNSFERILDDQRSVCLQNSGLGNNAVCVEFTETYEEGCNRLYSEKALQVREPNYCLGQEIKLKSLKFPYPTMNKPWYVVLQDTAAKNPIFNTFLSDLRWRMYSEIYRLGGLKINTKPGQAVSINGNDRNCAYWGISVFVDIALSLGAAPAQNILTTAYSGGLRNAVYHPGNGSQHRIPDQFGEQFNQAIAFSGGLAAPQSMAALLATMESEVKTKLATNFESLVNRLKGEWFRDSAFSELDRAYCELINVFQFFDPSFGPRNAQGSVVLDRLCEQFKAFFDNPSPVALRKLRSYLQDLKNKCVQGTILAEEFSQLSGEAPKEMLADLFVTSFAQHPLRDGLMHAENTLQSLIADLPSWQEPDRFLHRSSSVLSDFSTEQRLKTEDEIIANEEKITSLETELCQLTEHLQQEAVALHPPIRKILQEVVQQKTDMLLMLQEQRKMLCTKIYSGENETHENSVKQFATTSVGGGRAFFTEPMGQPESSSMAAARSAPSSLTG